MGRRGPAAAPTAIKALRGNPGRRPLPAEPPIPAATNLAVPSSLQGAGRIEWRRLAPILSQTGVLAESDVVAFENYCRALSDLRRYELKAKRVGMELAIAKGYAGMVLKIRAQVSQLAAQLGLTPSSRSQVRAHSTPKPGAKLMVFLGRKSVPDSKGE
jgi:P27 family predicted phage terminase small subunit